jgi:beta-barrel assembly-enhancing protease
MTRYFRVPAALLAGLMVLGPLSAPGSAQTTIKQNQPGFNLFSVQQDVDLGRQSAIEAEKQLPMLRDATVNNYLNRIVTRLAAAAPGAKYPYTIKAVNDSTINAFALPGGPMYVNRGLLEVSRSEAELAGVLAHEMAHVALRHGTHQASKAYLTKGGVSILGGLLGKPTGSTSRIINTIGGVGLNAVFMKFSRDDEYEADQTGAEIMARAGYNPEAMATMFELLRSHQGRSPGKLEAFFSSHPSPENREARIRQIATQLGPVQTRVVGGFEATKTRLSRLAGPSGTTTQLGRLDTETSQPTVVTGPVTVQVAPPSARYGRFTQASGFFSIDYPDNWNFYPSGFAVSLAPQGGVVTAENGAQIMVYGVIINHYQPFEGPSARRNSSLQRSYAPFEDRTTERGTLEDATDDLVRQIIVSNPYLTAEAGSARPETIDGAAGYSVVLSGRSPVTSEEERVTLFTRGLPDGHVIYAMSIAPARVADDVDRAFLKMMRGLVVNDDVVHRTRRTARAPQQ